MMRLQTITVLISCFLLSLAFMACGKADHTPSQETTAAASPSPSQAPTPGMVSSASVVRVVASGVEAAAGASVEASVNLTITDGYHLNANPPTLPHLIATELTVEPGEGITAGKPVYPTPVTKQFAFEKKPLAVYEGEAGIKLPLKIAGNVSPGAHTLRAKLRVQACDDQACYPPRTIDTSIPVTVK